MILEMPQQAGQMNKIRVAFQRFQPTWWRKSQDLLLRCTCSQLVGTPKVSAPKCSRRKTHLNLYSLEETFNLSLAAQVPVVATSPQREGFFFCYSHCHWKMLNWLNQKPVYFYLCFIHPSFSFPALLIMSDIEPHHTHENISVTEKNL